jgi:hypothetical protein
MMLYYNGGKFGGWVLEVFSSDDVISPGWLDNVWVITWWLLKWNMF